jgi:hypothetical protein
LLPGFDVEFDVEIDVETPRATSLQCGIVFADYNTSSIRKALKGRYQ